MRHGGLPNTSRRGWIKAVGPVYCLPRQLPNHSYHHQRLACVAASETPSHYEETDMHKTTTSIFKAIAAATLLTGAMSAQAAWELDGAASSFYYVTSKASAVSEVNSFTSLSGAITDAGAASLAINLASVDTGIDIRNERMRDIVFQVAQNAQATVSVTVDAAALNALAVGESTTGTYTANVSLHGISQDMSAELKVVKLASNTLQVSTVRPLIVGAATFGLAEEVEQLREIANLTSINPNIVVNFTLVYNQ